MSEISVGALSIPFGAMLVIVVMYFVMSQRAQARAAQEAERRRYEAERARQAAEEREAQARQAAEEARLREAQLAAAAATRREIEEENDAQEFWDNVMGIATSIVLSALSDGSEE